MSESMKILVIDDEESICFAFRRYFEHRGAKVTVAATVTLAPRCATACCATAKCTPRWSSWMFAWAT